MLLFIIILNLVITCISCYLVLQLWKVYNFLKKITSELIELEQQMNELLAEVPNLILAGQQQTIQVRQFYQKFLIQLGTTQRIFKRLKLLWTVWYRFGNVFFIKLG